MNGPSWLDARTIYLARHGSHAYGTAISSSDEDFRGIAIPPKEYFFGYLTHFEQSEQKIDNTETVIFDLRKFMKLASECNPNVLELLFVDPSDRVRVTSTGEKLLNHRTLFLSKKARYTFSGYAVSQLKRIQTHRRWLLDPPKAPPQREEFGLPKYTTIPQDQLSAAASMIRKKVESWQVDLDPLDDASKIELREKIISTLTEIHLKQEEGQWIAAGKDLGFSENFLMLLDRERQYRAAQRFWEQYQDWFKHRNPARAALEAKYGYDCKHAMHLVRLMRMCKELLETGTLRVRRPDAEELLAIRQGSWSYDQLMLWANQQEHELEEVSKRSSLPHSPDRVEIDHLCVELVEEMGFSSASA